MFLTLWFNYRSGYCLFVKDRDGFLNLMFVWWKYALVIKVLNCLFWAVFFHVDLTWSSGFSLFRFLRIWVDNMFSIAGLRNRKDLLWADSNGNILVQMPVLLEIIKAYNSFQVKGKLKIYSLLIWELMKLIRDVICFNWQLWFSCLLRHLKVKCYHSSSSDLTGRITFCNHLLS